MVGCVPFRGNRYALPQGKARGLAENDPVATLSGWLAEARTDPGGMVGVDVRALQVANWFGELEDGNYVSDTYRRLRGLAYEIYQVMCMSGYGKL